MLFSRRERLKKIAEQENQGASFWTRNFTKETRVRIIHAFIDATKYRMEECALIARGLILRDEGWLHLTSSSLAEVDDFLEYAMKCADDMMPTVIEAMHESMSSRRVSGAHPYNFHGETETILRESRVSYDLINGQMVEFSSREMHVAVISPVLKLLATNNTYSAVEAAYQDALREISDNKGADAITDAGTALQEMLNALGCKGNALGPLIKNARNKGIIAAHDVRLLDGLDVIMNWVSADRSESGDAHSSTQAAIADAWLTVHIVGALILRLAEADVKRPGK
ncbi:hypothetical protein ACVDFE_02935 [Lentzea chajnantorensis]